MNGWILIIIRVKNSQIVQLVQAPESNHGESSDEESEEPSVCSLVSHKEAVEAFDVTIRYLEQQPSMNSVQLMLLIKMRSSAMTECLKRYETNQYNRLFSSPTLTFIYSINMYLE